MAMDNIRFVVDISNDVIQIFHANEEPLSVPEFEAWRDSDTGGYCIDIEVFLLIAPKEWIKASGVRAVYGE